MVPVHARLFWECIQVDSLAEVFRYHSLIFIMSLWPLEIRTHTAEATAPRPRSPLAERLARPRIVSHSGLLLPSHGLACLPPPSSYHDMISRCHPMSNLYNQTPSIIPIICPAFPRVCTAWRSGCMWCRCNRQGGDEEMNGVWEIAGGGGGGLQGTLHTRREEKENQRWEVKKPKRTRSFERMRGQSKEGRGRHDLIS